MSDFEKWKIATQIAMKKFLLNYGWPEILDETIMKLLPTMFRYLDSRDLIPQGFTYQRFYQAAYKQYVKANEVKRT